MATLVCHAAVRPVTFRQDNRFRFVMEMTFMSRDRRTQFQRFPTTHWSLVDLAAAGRNTIQRDALDRLLTRYWPALKAHLVLKKRIESNEAEDLVQGFIENKILERDLISKAESGRGRFRSLLATALDNYAANQMRQRNAAKREADRATSLDQEAYEHCAATTDAPHDAFDVAWAREILAEILRQMQAECKQSGHDDAWAVFQVRVLAPILEGAEPPSYEQIVDRFGFRSPTQASNALVTGKRMFSRIMRSVISEYADDEDDIDAEIQDLQDILTRSGPQA